jgi:hypothetical protein
MYNKHSLLHSTVKPHQCNVCLLSFRHQSTLCRHTKVHLKNIQCHLCHQIFRYESFLKKHLIDCHSDVDAINNPPEGYHLYLIKIPRRKKNKKNDAAAAAATNIEDYQDEEDANDVETTGTTGGINHQTSGFQFAPSTTTGGHLSGGVIVNGMNFFG